jgi:aspartyl protease family protein
MNRFLVMLLAVGALLSGVPAMMQDTSQPDTGSSKPVVKLASVKPQTISTSTPSGSVRLKPDERGHYVAEFKMNGRSVTALVDTGASMVAINKTTARKLGINVSPADFKYEVSTANGNIKVAAAVIREIQIGRVKVRDVEAAVLDDRALDGTLLGMSFLKRLDGFTVSKGDLILKQ